MKFCFGELKHYVWPNIFALKIPKANSLFPNRPAYTAAREAQTEFLIL